MNVGARFGLAAVLMVLTACVITITKVQKPAISEGLLFVAMVIGAIVFVVGGGK